MAIEKKRMAKKGLANSFIAFVLFFILMSVGVELGREYWPEKIENKISFVFYGTFIIHLTSQIFIFLLYLPAYMGWTKAYEKYLINKQSTRPWERKNWP